MRGELIAVDGLAQIVDWPDHDELATLLRDAAEAHGATVLEARLLRLPDPLRSRPDSPPGGTAWVGLDESHVALHWYTGRKRVRFALDVFTCGKHADAEAIADQIVEELGTERVRRRQMLKRF